MAGGYHGADPNRNDQSGRAGTPGGGGRGAFGGDRGGLGMGGQMQRNRLGEIARIGQATGMSPMAGRGGVSPAGRVSNVLGGMTRDYQNRGMGIPGQAANMIGSALGFNEQAPTMQAALDRVRGMPAGTALDTRANWGWDPAGLAGTLGGAAVGMPAGGGMIADLVSRGLGRPFEVGLGPQVFGGPGGAPSMPSRQAADRAFAAQGGPGAPRTGPAGGRDRAAPALAAKSIPAPGMPGGQQTQKAQALAQKQAQQPRTFNPYPGALPPGLGGTISVPKPGQLGPGIGAALPPNYFMSQMT